MTRNSNALMRDGSVMADSDLVDFLSGPTDSAINFNGSADLHAPIQPPPTVSPEIRRGWAYIYLTSLSAKCNLDKICVHKEFALVREDPKDR